MPVSHDTHEGIVTPDELYSLTALKRRLSITDSTLRSARRSGLRVYYAHKQGFVLGKHWIEHVLNSGVCSNDRPTSDTDMGEAE
jgi:hypothetical protein